MGADDAIGFGTGITESENVPHSLYNWGQWGDTTADSLWFGQYAADSDFFGQGLPTEPDIASMWD